MMERRNAVRRELLLNLPWIIAYALVITPWMLIWVTDVIRMVRICINPAESSGIVTHVSDHLLPMGTFIRYCFTDSHGKVWVGYDWDMPSDSVAQGSWIVGQKVNVIYLATNPRVSAIEGPALLAILASLGCIGVFGGLLYCSLRYVVTLLSLMSGDASESR